MQFTAIIDRMCWVFAQRLPIDRRGIAPADDAERTAGLGYAWRDRGERFTYSGNFREAKVKASSLAKSMFALANRFA